MNNNNELENFNSMVSNCGLLSIVSMYIQALSNTRPQSRWSLTLVWIQQPIRKSPLWKPTNGRKWHTQTVEPNKQPKAEMLLAAQKSLSFWRPSRSSGLKQPQQLVGDEWESKLTSRAITPFLPASLRKTYKTGPLQQLLKGKGRERKHQCMFSPQGQHHFLGSKGAGIFRMMLRMGKLPEIHV